MLHYNDLMQDLMRLSTKCHALSVFYYPALDPNPDTSTALLKTVTLLLRQDLTTQVGKAIDCRLQASQSLGGMHLHA